MQHLLKKDDFNFEEYSYTFKNEYFSVEIFEEDFTEEEISFTN